MYPQVLKSSVTVLPFFINICTQAKTGFMRPKHCDKQK